MMRKWDDYKETMKAEPVVYQAARDGELGPIIMEIENGFPTIGSLDTKNSKGHSLLMLAAYNNQIKLTKFLITKGADVNSLDNAGNSILMGAAFKGYADVCQVLLDSNADATFKNFQGQSALDFAHMFGRTEVAQLLSIKTSEKYQPIKGFFKSWFGLTTNLSKGA